MSRKGLLPESPLKGMVPTMNHTGWMIENPDRVSMAFAEYAGHIDGEALDIGCAYGVATLAALKHGARVLACDIEQQHLDVLEQLVPADARERVRTQVATLPYVDFEPARFGAVLASRVLHFLSPADVELTIVKAHRWLAPGGRLFLVADSPFSGPWKTKAPEYEQRKAAGDDWPGHFEDYAQFLRPGADPAEHPRFINVMDPDILERVCRSAGFGIIEAAWLRSGTEWGSERDHAGVICERLHPAL